MDTNEIIDNLVKLNKAVQSNNNLTSKIQNDINCFTTNTIDEVANRKDVKLNEIFNNFSLIVLRGFDNYFNEHIDEQTCKNGSLETLISLPIKLKEKYSDVFVNYVIELYSKYECFRNAFNDEVKTTFEIFDKLMELITSTFEKRYIDFVMNQFSKYREIRRKFFKVIDDSNIRKLNLSVCQENIILKYIAIEENKFNKYIIDNKSIIQIKINDIIKHANLKLYKFLIDNDVIKPELGHLETCCGQHIINIEFIKFILDHKVIPNHECFEKILLNYSNSQSEIVNMFYDIGIELTEQDLLIITKQKIIINNFDNDELLTNNFFRTCIDIQFYPPYVSRYKIPKMLLYYLFSKTNIKFIPVFVRNEIHDCDLNCLFYACTIPNNIFTIKFILEKNIPATQQSIYETIGDEYNKNKSLKKLIEKYNK
jgi:hypothetical protein